MAKVGSPELVKEVRNGRGSWVAGQLHQPAHQVLVLGEEALQ